MQDDNAASRVGDAREEKEGRGAEPPAHIIKLQLRAVLCESLPRPPEGLNNVRTKTAALVIS